MKYLATVLSVILMISFSACSKDDNLINNDVIDSELQDQNIEVFECFDPASSPAVITNIVRENWFSEEFVVSHSMQLSDDKNNIVFMSNCEVNEGLKDLSFSYECMDSTYALDYQSEWVSYVVFSAQMDHLGSSINTDKAAVFNEETGQIDFIQTISAWGIVNGSQVWVEEHSDGSVVVRKGKHHDQITINSVTFKNAYTSADKVEDSSLVLTQKDGVVAILSEEGNWWVLEK